MENIKRNRHINQMLILMLTFVLVFTMVPQVAFATDDNDTYGFNVKSSSGEALTVNKAENLQSLERYYVDAAGSQITIETETLVLKDCSTNQFNVDDAENIVPFAVSKPTEEQSTQLEAYRTYVEDIGVPTETYDNFSIVLIIKNQQATGFILIRWEKENNNTYGFNVKSSSGEALTVNKAENLQSLERYYVDAAGSQITIETETLVLKDCSTNQFNVDDAENIVPFAVSKPTEEQSTQLEAYRAYVKDIGVPTETYDNFSIVLIIKESADNRIYSYSLGKE